MIAQRSRIMEAREAAGLDRKRQQFSMERDICEPQASGLHAARVHVASAVLGKARARTQTLKPDGETMNRKNEKKTLRTLDNEELKAVAGGSLATCGKLGTVEMAYYDNKAAGNDGVAAFLGGFLNGAGCDVPAHH